MNFNRKNAINKAYTFPRSDAIKVVVNAADLQQSFTETENSNA